jgi:hypothetical protein
MDNPWDDLDEYAEALLKAEAERQGCGLRDLGVLSRRRQAHIRKYEVPLSQVPLPQDDEDNDA